MFVDTQCFHLTITDSLCQSTTINARSIIDFTDHFIVHQWTRCRELQWYSDSMNNDNNQWSTSPTCIWCRYNDTMNNDNDNDGNPVIGPRDWKQQKLRRGFKQNSAICLQTFSTQNDSRHPPLAGKILPLQPWQNCLYRWFLIQHNWWITYHIFSCPDNTVL